MPINWGEIIPEFVGYFVGSETLRKMFGMGARQAAEKVGEKAAEAIKSKFAGIGEADELLSLDACTLAIEKFGTKPDDIVRVAKVFKGLSLEKRNKIVRIIGYDEQKVTTEIESKEKKKPAEGESKDEKKPDAKTKEKDKQAKKTETTLGNLRGARIINFLCQIKQEQDLKDVLEGFNCTVVTSEVVDEIMKQGVERIKMVKKVAEDGYNKVMANPIGQNVINFLDEKMKQRTKALRG